MSSRPLWVMLVSLFQKHNFFFKANHSKSCSTKWDWGIGPYWGLTETRQECVRQISALTLLWHTVVSLLKAECTAGKDGRCVTDSYLGSWWLRPVIPTPEAWQEDWKFKVNLHNLLRTCLKNGSWKRQRNWIEFSKEEVEKKKLGMGIAYKYGSMTELLRNKK